MKNRKKTNVEKRTKKSCRSNTCRLRDRGKLCVGGASGKTFETGKHAETRKIGNTRNGPIARTRPPSDPVSFRRNLGFFRKRCNLLYLSPPLSRHTPANGPSNAVRRRGVRAVGMIAARVRRRFDFLPMFTHEITRRPVRVLSPPPPPGGFNTTMITTVRRRRRTARMDSRYRTLRTTITTGPPIPCRAPSGFRGVPGDLPTRWFT